MRPFLADTLMFIQSNFNNREIASFVWILVFAIWASSNPKVRQSFVRLLQIFFSPKIILPTFVMFCYIATCVYGLHLIGIWKLEHLKGTIYWCIGGAFVLFLNTNKANEDPQYFRKTMIDNIKLACILEYIVGLHAFNLIVEFITMPIVVLFAGSLALAEAKEEYKQVKKLLAILLGGYSVTLLSFSIFKIARNISAYADYSHFIDFVLPLAYTALLLPLIYAFALWMSYEMLFVRMGIFNKDNKELLRYAKRRILISFNLNLRRLNQWVNAMGGNLKIRSKEEFLMSLALPNSDTEAR